MFAERVLSGMRPTGALHLGHYHGALKNWVRLQADYECFYFVADWHALTTHYEEREVIEKNVYDMVIDWIAAGLDPEQCTIFIQSRLPEHAELFTLLAMGTPLGWLERVPTYKDQIEKLSDRDLATYGFLGYPLLQAADILIYRASYVPVGEDQSSHVELTREVARRFNHLYGRGAGFEQHLEHALQPVLGLAVDARVVLDRHLGHAAALPAGVDGDEAVHLAVELHAEHDVAAVGLEGAAVVVQGHAGDARDQPVGDLRRDLACGGLVLPVLAPAARGRRGTWPDGWRRQDSSLRRASPPHNSTEDRRRCGDAVSL